MISNSITSTISLRFNNSWMAHMGSRVYRIALQTLGGLFGDTFGPNQLYSGERLYRLVDTYRQSKRDRMSYDRARFYYAGGIATALRGERDPIEKTRKAKSILNTHIMGLSILQAKHKASLSKHISYTLLPSLIEDFGKKMANRSIETLHELDSLDASRNDNVNQYVNLYRNIAVQQKELDSFVQALDQLDSGISKDILINELLLARNRHLSKTAKEKIAAILQSKHYIDIKLHNKLQMVELIRKSDPKAEFNESAILSTLHENRDNQLQALCHMGPSMFFTSDELDNISLKKENTVSNTEELVVSEKSSLEEVLSTEEFPSTLDNISVKNEDTVSNTEEPVVSENSSLEKEVLSTENIPSTSDILCAQENLRPPVGISNTQLNCWYNSTLQILSNTPICLDILAQKKKFSTEFPSMFHSFNLYQRILLNQALYAENLSKLKIVNIDSYLTNIRKEAHNNLDKEFQEVEIAQEDSQRFIYSLLTKLSIPVAHQIWLPGEEILSAEERHLLLEKPAPSQLVDNPNIGLIKIDLKTLFADTDHQLYGVIFHCGANYKRGRDFNGGHYFAAVKVKDSWYMCDDSRVTRISETAVEDLIQKNKALLIASRLDMPDIESDVD